MSKGAHQGPGRASGRGSTGRTSPRRVEEQTRRRLDRLVPRPGDLEEDLLLETSLPVQLSAPSAVKA